MWIKIIKGKRDEENSAVSIQRYEARRLHTIWITQQKLCEMRQGGRVKPERRRKNEKKERKGGNTYIQWVNKKRSYRNAS